MGRANCILEHPTPINSHAIPPHPIQTTTDESKITVLSRKGSVYRHVSIMQIDTVPETPAPARGTAPKTPEKTARFAPLPGKADPDPPSFNAPQTPTEFRKAMAAQSPTNLGLLMTPARRFKRTMRIETETVPAAATPSMFNTPPRRPGRTPAKSQAVDADTVDFLPPPTPTRTKRDSLSRPDYIPRSSEVVAEARRLQEAEKADVRARMGRGNKDEHDRSPRGGNRGL